MNPSHLRMEYGKQLLYTQVLKEALNEVLGDAKGFRESVQALHNFGDIFFSKSSWSHAVDEGPQRERLYFADRRDR